MKELMPLDNVNAVTVFSEGGLDSLLDKIEKEAKSHVPDLKTDKGRKAIASMASKVSKSKTYLDGLGKVLVSGWKKQAKEVDGERKRMRDTLDDLRDKVRSPLTEWEESEKNRKESTLKKINNIESSASFISENWQNIDIDIMNVALKEITDCINVDFYEFEGYAIDVMDDAAVKIQTAIEKRVNYDNDQAELNLLREEKAANDEKERNEKEEREKADRAEKEAKERNERETRIAKEAKEKAELKAKEDADRAEKEKQAAIDAQKAAELRAEQAEKQAKIDAEDAAKAERKKIEAEKETERLAAEKREANVRHKKKINNEAVSSLVAIGLDEGTAKKVVVAIAKKEINNVSIFY